LVNEDERSLRAMTELDGMTALVTGGTSGIGRAAAEVMLSRGVAVAVCGVGDGVAEAARELTAAYGEKSVRVATVDVTKSEELRHWVEESAAHFGGLDAVVTAAGVQTYGSAMDTPEQVWDRTQEVNVKGTFLTVKHAMPHLRRRGGGAIVAVSSVQAFICQAGVAAYSASKGALNALIRTVAIDEARHGIRANAVCPASVDTPMLRASARSFSDGTEQGEQALIDEWGAMHPLGRVARPREVGEVIAFLAGPRASFVTGVSLPVDGGLLSSVAVSLPG
jgi:NAD(P)-dependent dehydrogenase (short-subunit alcohol dehydrogenase family)